MSSDTIDSPIIDSALFDKVLLSGIVNATGNRWAFGVRGYRSINQSGCTPDMAWRYYDAGFNVLTLGLRTYDNSESASMGAVSR